MWIWWNHNFVKSKTRQAFSLCLTAHPWYEGWRPSQHNSHWSLSNSCWYFRLDLGSRSSPTPQVQISDTFCPSSERCRRCPSSLHGFGKLQERNIGEYQCLLVTRDGIREAWRKGITSSWFGDCSAKDGFFHFVLGALAESVCPAASGIASWNRFYLIGALINQLDSQNWVHQKE